MVDESRIHAIYQGECISKLQSIEGNPLPQAQQIPEEVRVYGRKLEMDLERAAAASAEAGAVLHNLQAHSSTRDIIMDQAFKALPPDVQNQFNLALQAAGQ